jgi:MFS transporter, PAT family, beta-lactamase induction signal transducer AmpG
MTGDLTSNARSTSAGCGPWWWVPSLYFAQGVPYVVVMTVAVIMFKRLGVGNTEIALYTSWLYLPYAIKPLWSPLVQRIGTRRSWVIVMQLLVAAGLACAALAIPLDSFLRWSLVALAAVAICSATHDVAADGFYLLALTGHQQAWFVGIRSTAYRMAMIAGQGLLVMLAGALESSTGLPVIDIQVQAADRGGGAPRFAPEEFKAARTGDSQGILTAQPSFEISFRGRPASNMKSAKEAVRAWNVGHGFYSAAESPATKANAKRPWVVQLEEFIRRRFGPTKEHVTAGNDRAGDVAIVLMRLAGPVPVGEQQVVQFGRSAGDNNFDVVEGDRFELTEANWTQPFAAVVQVDAKLDRPSQATFQVRSGNLRLAWSATFLVVAAMFLAFCIYHAVALPRPAADLAATATVAMTETGIAAFLVPFVDFFRKPRILAVLAFLLLYRFPEAQLVKLTTPFLLDPREVGGLALTTSEVGVVYGTVGVAMLTVGGLIGGFVVARGGLGRCLWPMALATHLPNLAFLFLAYAQPESRWAITAAVAIEQFGYGFGFTAYMLYCVYVATGKHQTVHYALCTGCMALGMMIPGMWSGWLEELIGYQHFFVWIMLAMIPSLLAVALVPVDADFGKPAEPQPTS